jgi:hypothetical protein
LHYTNSFTLAPAASAGVREKFVDGFDGLPRIELVELNPAGLGENSKTTKSGRTSKIDSTIYE